MPQLKPAISAPNAAKSAPHLPAAAAAVTTLILSLLLAAPTACAKTQPPMVGVTGVARPWRDVQLSFSRAGRIEKIFVHRGQMVKAGQILAQESDDRQILERQVAALAAGSTVRIQAAEAQLAQAEVNLKKERWAASQHAATDFEVQRAALKVAMDKLNVQLARMRHQKDLLTLKAADLAVKRRQIRAPFAGIIENRYVQAGGAIAAFKKVLRLISIRRLRIIAPVPVTLAGQLQPGQGVRAAVGGIRAPGRILWIGRVVDAASGTVNVGLEIDGKSGIWAGEQVT